VLRHTTPDLGVDEVRRLAPDLARVATSDGGAPRSRRVGASHALNLVQRQANGKWKLVAPLP
jgi:hypothetical protein